MTTLQFIGVIVAALLGSTVLSKLVEGLFGRSISKGNLYKIKADADTIVLEKEIKVSEYYKKEWQELLEKHNRLEEEFNQQTIKYENSMAELRNLQKQMQDLQVKLSKTKLFNQ